MPECERHGIIVEALVEGTRTMTNLAEGQQRLERKIDLLVDRQMGFIEQVTRIDGIVSNGLSSNVEGITKKLDLMCEKFGKRLVELEQYKSILSLLHGFKEKTFAYVITIAFTGSLILVLMHFGSKIIQGYLK